MPLATAVMIRVRWWRAVTRDWTSYRAGIVVAHPRAFQLPGVLAATMLVSAEDGFGGRYGLVWDRHTGYLTATVRVTPASAWLADRADADTWVASWGAWLASLGHIPSVSLGHGHCRHRARSRGPPWPTRSRPRSARTPRPPPGRSSPPSRRPRRMRPRTPRSA